MPTNKSTMELHELRFNPPRLKDDGARRTRPSVELRMVHQGKDAVPLASFLAGLDGLVSCKIQPRGSASNVAPWAGVVHIKPVKLKAPDTGARAEERGGDEFPEITIPIVAEHNSTEPLLGLIELRAAMVEDGDAFQAAVTLSPYQGKLPFGEEPVRETEGDLAADEWGKAADGAVPSAGAPPKAPRAKKAGVKPGAGPKGGTAQSRRKRSTKKKAARRRGPKLVT